MLLALTESSISTLPRNSKCSHHKPMISGVHSRSRSYDKSCNIKSSVVFSSHDSSQNYVPYSNRSIKRKLKNTTQVNILNTLPLAHTYNCSLLPFLKSHRFSYERKFYLSLSSVLEVHWLMPYLLQLSGSL